MCASTPGLPKERCELGLPRRFPWDVQVFDQRTYGNAMPTGLKPGQMAQRHLCMVRCAKA